jgi:metal-responsive CopG/Arc/MetJ family transcriptional regulator
MAREVMRTHVVIPKDVVESIDRTVGRRARSRFLAEAAEEKLARLRRLRAFERVAGSLRDVAIPGWETSESAAEWVSASRREDDERLRRRVEDAG